MFSSPVTHCLGPASTLDFLSTYAFKIFSLPVCMLTSYCSQLHTLTSYPPPIFLDPLHFYTFQPLQHLQCLRYMYYYIQFIQPHHLLLQTSLYPLTPVSEAQTCSYSTATSTCQSAHHDTFRSAHGGGVDPPVAEQVCL